jgi:hypothetical protein
MKKSVSEFLEEMYKLVKDEETKKLERNIADVVKKKLDVMIDANIVSMEDANEFCANKNISMSTSRKSKSTRSESAASLASDTCSRPTFSQMSPCSSSQRPC